MGCHTWFSRPITEEEFKLMRDYAPTEIYNTTLYDDCLYKLLMKSYNEDIPCVYGKYWWQLGYGSSNPKLLECIDENKQIHTYLKQEECKVAYLVVFINKESDVDKINTLIKKASEYTDKYNIYINDVDCIKRDSASHR